MTIVAGFNCMDGVVIAADSLISAQGWHQYEESKLSHISGFDWSLFWAYSGIPSYAKEAEEKISARLTALEGSNTSPEEGNFLQIDHVRAGVESTLSEMYQQHFQQLDLHMLMACAARSEDTQLWAFNNGAFHTVQSCDFLGVGDSSLIRCLKQLYASPRDQVEYCESVAIYCVEQAKKYINGCGGKTEVISVKTMLDFQWLSESDIQSRIAAMNQREIGALRKIIS